MHVPGWAHVISHINEAPQVRLHPALQSTLHFDEAGPHTVGQPPPRHFTLHVEFSVVQSVLQPPAQLTLHVAF